MSEPKFTPGPWEIEEDLFDHDWAISAPKWGALARVVAEMDDDGTGKSWTKSETGEANAHLIAAAPDLYYALDCILKELPTKRDWLDPVTEAMAKQALKAARGEK